MDSPPHPPRRHAVVASQLGPLRVVVDAGGSLAGVYLPGHDPAPGEETLGALVDAGAAADDALAAAVAGVLAVVDDPETDPALPLAQVPGTLFQHAVWAEVARIGVGATLGYAEIAAAVGRPAARRAVGTAVAANPRCLVVPCHRVVGSGGAITGYAGGVDLKRWLLAREQRLVPPPVVPPDGAPPDGAVVDDADAADGLRPA